MTIEFTLDTVATLEMRKKLAAENIVLYSALENTSKKAEWLAVYKALSSLTDSSTVMDILLPE